jgi:hypothetical protein
VPPALPGTFTLELTGTGFDSPLYVVTDCADVGGTCLGAVGSASSGLSISRVDHRPRVSALETLIAIDRRCPRCSTGYSA